MKNGDFEKKKINKIQIIYKKIYKFVKNKENK